MPTNRHDPPPLPTISPRTAWTAWAACVFAAWLLLFAYHHLGALTEGREQPWLRPFVSEFTSALGMGLLFWLLHGFCARWPLEGRGAWRRLPGYALLLVLASTLHTSFVWASRSLLWQLLGMGSYAFGEMPLRYVMELPLQLIGLVILVGGIHAYRRIVRSRERELHTERVERDLALSQLRELQHQLHPHFLFNTLHTISSLLRSDPDRADSIIEKLGDLLRSSLGRRRVSTLHEELELIDDYVEIMRARFGDGLEVTIDVPDELSEALVPSLLLQPLVENSIRHGGVETRGSGAIHIEASSGAGEQMLLRVLDDGEALDPNTGLAGQGLRITRERLRLHYGDDQHLRAEPLEPGFLVELRLPISFLEEDPPVRGFGEQTPGGASCSGR